MSRKAPRKIGKKKETNRDRFWNLYLAFCYAENESKTYSEAISRHKFFMANQTLLKKPPSGAQASKLCYLIHARRIWFGRPVKMPSTIYDYTWKLVRSLYNHYNYIQDAFGILASDTDICTIVSLWRDAIEGHFSGINPDASAIENAALIARSLAGTRGRAFNDAVGIVDSWRRSGHESDFVRLQGLLHGHKIVLPDPCGMDTQKCFTSIHTAESRGEYEFTWPGKDIAVWLSETKENGRLRFKEELFGECADGERIRAMDMECDVSKIASSGELTDPDYRLDESKNHYIEGDNLRALKLLLPQYSGKIKMIYIDPPYNTGNKFVYNDKFREETEMYERFLLCPIPHAKFEDMSRTHLGARHER